MEHSAIRNDLMKTPDSEVKVERQKRRRLTAQYKLDVLKKADLCLARDGSLGELLRREGLYSSQLAEWRRQRKEGMLSAFGRKRGPKPKWTDTARENQRLNKEVRRLSKKLEQAQLIIEAQKKIAEILGNPLESDSSDEDKS
jgi:transposase